MIGSETMAGPDVGSVNLLDLEVMESHFEAQTDPVQAIPTPLASWNRHCRDEGGGVGLAYGWHVTVAGATGKGKSLLGLNIAARALFVGHAVGFVSFEMSRAQLATRLYAIATKTPVRKLERGDDFSPAATECVIERLSGISRGAALYTNDGPLRDIRQALDLMRWWREERFCRLFVVDYLQLAQSRDAESEYHAVSDVSRRVRQFAVEHDAVTVGLSQLNRSTSSNRDDSPIVEGLKSTSSLEQDSDQVLLLDHSRYKREKGADSSDRAKTFMLLAKNRHGGTGEIPVEWNYRTLRIREAKPDEEHEWPGVGR